MLAVLAYFIATGDAEQISNALSGAATAVSRTASIYAPETPYLYVYAAVYICFMAAKPEKMIICTIA